MGGNFLEVPMLLYPNKVGKHLFEIQHFTTIKEISYFRGSDRKVCELKWKLVVKLSCLKSLFVNSISCMAIILWQNLSLIMKDFASSY